MLGIVDGAVEALLVDKSIDQLVADHARFRLQRFDGLGCERRQQDHARHAMLWRIGRDRRRAAAAFRMHLTHRRPARGEMIGVVGHCPHVGVARRQVDALEALGVGDRAPLAEVLPDRERIVDPLRIRVVPIGGPILDGATRALLHVSLN